MNRVIHLSLMGVLLVLLQAVSGGGSSGTPVAGIGGTGKIASGTITGFGSIFVNGVEYQTGSASFTVDDNPGSETDLRVGMVVTVTGTVSGTSGTATSVVFDDNIEGPVVVADPLKFPDPDGLTKTFSVLGTTVIADSGSTIFDNAFAGFGFASLASNDVVEISGFFDGAGVLHATFIEKKGTLVAGTTPVELKGTAANTGGGAGAGGSFTLNGLTVDIQAGADLSDVPGATVTDGMFVEVQGVFVNATRIDATRIEQETAGLGADVSDASVEGLISGFVNFSNFQVAGQAVDASAASFNPPALVLANGVKVEVEGPIVGGVLIADEVEARGDSIKVHATVNSLSVTDASTNTGTLTLNLPGTTLTLSTNSQTSFEDKTGADTTPPLKLNEINSGDFLEVQGFLDGGGTLIATEVRRDSADDVIVQAPVQSFASGSSITLLGVTFFTDAATQFEGTDDAPFPGGPAGFYGALSVGDLVKIKDQQPGDGTAEEVDRES